MADAHDEEWSWSRQACSYVKNWGWNILPLSPRAGSGKDAEPVVQQLGATPLVEPSKATSDPDVIEEWGNRFEEVEIGIVTGAASNVLAVEVMLGEYGGGEKEVFRERLLDITGGHCAFGSRSRAYVLIPHAHLESPLPPMTRRRGAVLHGEGSIVYAPWTRFQWADNHLTKDRGPVREVVEVTLSMFRLGDHLTPNPEPEGTEDFRQSEEGFRKDPNVESENGQGDEAPPPWHRENDAGESCVGQGNPTASRYFRSGEQLRCSAAPERRLDLPWTVPGGLSVLTGPPKTVGKSSWLLSLASRLAAGEPFLGTEVSPSTVVMLADSSPTTMRELLAWHELSDEALSRLHIAHPQDLTRAGWGQTLDRTYEHAQRVEADLLIVDCLDQYVTFKGGPDPTESSRVLHQLTARAPADVPLLCVKSTSCSGEEPLSHTIERLGVLGIGADAVVRLDDVSMPRFPCLRRVLTASRKGTAPQLHMCALRSGRYERVHREMTGHSEQALLGRPDRQHNGEAATFDTARVLSS